MLKIRARRRSRSGDLSSGRFPKILKSDRQKFCCSKKYICNLTLTLIMNLPKMLYKIKIWSWFWTLNLKVNSQLIFALIHVWFDPMARATVSNSKFSLLKNLLLVVFSDHEAPKIFYSFWFKVQLGKHITLDVLIIRLTC